MNMTFEEVRLYHYRLWDEIVRDLPRYINLSLYTIKKGVFEKLSSKGLVPKMYPRNGCYLCECYSMVCRDCPLEGCDLYDELIEAIEEQDVKKAVALAEAIRDIYEKEG